MAEVASGERAIRAGHEWRPAEPIELAPLGDWPVRPGRLLAWFLGYPGYIWPFNAFWLAVTIAIWTWATPDLATMKTLEVWWVGAILARNVALITVLFGGMHLWLYVLRVQGDDSRFTTKPFAKGLRRFRFRDQVRDNMFHSLVWGVPIMTAYEVATYWLFANGYIGWFDLGEGTFAFWAWFVALLLLAPLIHTAHFYFGHRLLHEPFLYRHVHSLHHNNVEVGPWSGLSMHPVEHVIYFSTVVVQWVLAPHPLNALFQIHIAAFYPAVGHCGFDRFKVGTVDIDAGCHFHYLHHRYFECNYGGTQLPLDRWFGTFHDGTPEALKAMRARMKARRIEDRVAD